MEDLLTARELKERLTTNDNRMTASPYLLYLQEKRTFVGHPEYSNGTERWAEHYSGDYMTADTKEDLIARIKEGMDEFELEDFKESDWHINSHIEDYHWETKNVFLTDKGYEDHKKLNGHNLQEHRTYGTHAFRNREMSSLIALIDRVIELEDSIAKANLTQHEEK